MMTKSIYLISLFHTTSLHVYQLLLVASINERLRSLEETRGALQADVQENLAHGDALEALVRDRCVPVELERYSLFIGDLERVVNLLLCLSARLARVQNALSTVDQHTDAEEKVSNPNLPSSFAGFPQIRVLWVPVKIPLIYFRTAMIHRSLKLNKSNIRAYQSSLFLHLPLSGELFILCTNPSMLGVKGQPNQIINMWLNCCRYLLQHADELLARKKMAVRVGSARLLP